VLELLKEEATIEEPEALEMLEGELDAWTRVLLEGELEA